MIKERFNSQPPEGGWPILNLRVITTREFQLTAARRRLGLIRVMSVIPLMCFNSQPPEGGWAYTAYTLVEPLLFQLTAARRRLAVGFTAANMRFGVSTHSRPKAAGLPQKTMS